MGGALSKLLCKHRVPPRNNASPEEACAHLRVQTRSSVYNILPSRKCGMWVPGASWMPAWRGWF